MTACIAECALDFRYSYFYPKNSSVFTPATSLLLGVTVRERHQWFYDESIVAVVANVTSYQPINPAGMPSSYPYRKYIHFSVYVSGWH
jgi:hypothetical protein